MCARSWGKACAEWKKGQKIDNIDKLAQAANFSDDMHNLNPGNERRIKVDVRVAWKPQKAESAACHSRLTPGRSNAVEIWTIVGSGR